MVTGPERSLGLHTLWAVRGELPCEDGGELGWRERDILGRRHCHKRAKDGSERREGQGVAHVDLEG